jgi:hypothetical protein
MYRFWSEKLMQGTTCKPRRRREDNIKWFFKEWGGDVE